MGGVDKKRGLHCSISICLSYMDWLLNRRAIKKLVRQATKTGLRIKRFLVGANARNIAEMGVRVHAATNAPIPARVYVVGK